MFDVSPVKTYGNDYLLVAAMGKLRRVGFSLQGDTLTLTDERGQKHVFRRLAAVPRELELKGLALGKQDKVPEEKLKNIRQALARRLKLDQDMRKKLMDPAVLSKLKTEADWKPLLKEFAKVDGDNTRWLKSLVQEMGWIDVSRFGAEASDDAFLIVQHSGDLRLMMAALPEIEKDVRAKRFKDGQPYAMLYDRVKVNLGERQRYGTQTEMSEKGALLVLPLENRAKVEEYRQELGLLPLLKYLDVLKQMTGAKEVVFQGD
jgi:hypothetical protein